MKFNCLDSDRQINVNINPYLIDWNPAREVSKPQAAVKKFLYPFWKSQVVLEEFRIPRTLLRVDILSLTKRCSIEISPKGSHSYNKFFHKNRAKYLAAIKREIMKVRWLEQNGFVVCEIYDEDIPMLSREWFEDKYNISL